MVFTDGDKTLTVKGFECEVDGLPLLLRDAFASSCVRTRVWAEKGTLKIAWSMPGRKVVAADPVEPYGGAVPPSWRQDGDVVSFEADSNAFAYRLKYR